MSLSSVLGVLIFFDDLVITVQGCHRQKIHFDKNMAAALNINPSSSSSSSSQDSPPERPLPPLDMLSDAADLVVEVGEDSAAAGAALIGLVSHASVLVLEQEAEINS